jgi:hypothetical protein
MSKNSKPKIMTKFKVLLFGGEIGGIGKSMVARVAVEQKIAAKQSFYLIDADASTPNVGLTYEKAMYEKFMTEGILAEDDLPPTLGSVNSKSPPVLYEQITFTGDAKSYLAADKILLMANVKDVIVVLPSQVSVYVNRWFEQNDIAGMLADADNKIELCYFFVTNGTPESIALFIESVEYYEGKIPHVLVKNLGAMTNIDWKWFDRDKQAANVLTKHGFKSIDFPELVILPEIKTEIISKNIPFGEAMKSDWMPFPSKRRIGTWLEKATQALASSSYLPAHPDYPLQEQAAVAPIPGEKPAETA